MIETEREILQEAIREEQWDRIPALFGEIHPADIADAIEHAPSENRSVLFNLVAEENKADVLSRLEPSVATGILEETDDSSVASLAQEMAPDDAADIIGLLEANRAAAVLGMMEREDSEDLSKLLEYEDDSAGGIMTSDVVAMYADQTVQEAIEAIAYVEAPEPFYNANIVDKEGKLVGYIDIWDLLRERNRTKQLGELAQRDFQAATTDMDQEEVAHMLGKYDLAVLPVVDAEGKLVGRITSDDVIDVMEEEASEDIFRMAGSDDAELESDSPLKSSIVRLPWLLITLVGGFAVTYVLKQFHAAVSHTMILGAFVPVLLAMGGNAGIQSSTLTVRSISLGDIKEKRILPLLIREITTGAMMGLVCGLAIGIYAFILAMTSPEEGSVEPLHLAGIVSLALFSAMAFAAMFGTLVPIVLDKLNVDPAVASGPFITIANDIAALLIYFGITISLVQQLG